MVQIIIVTACLKYNSSKDTYRAVITHKMWIIGQVFLRVLWKTGIYLWRIITKKLYRCSKTIANPIHQKLF